MQYIDGIKGIAERSPLFAGKHLHIKIIANPVAGGFSIKKRARANGEALDAAFERSQTEQVTTLSCSAAMHLTTAVGHARELARAVLDEALACAVPDSVFLVVTAGGDGTSLEVQSEFARCVIDEKKKELVDRVCLLRLPLGTANDGSDGRYLHESLELLSGHAVFARQSAVGVRTSGYKPAHRYAFNIASVGLDAFVTHMTNRLKGKLPGDFYKLFLDIACLFYNKIYTVAEMDITGYGADGAPLQHHRDRMILCLMGASGYRSYGSHQQILPGPDNVCAVREMPILRKLSLKKKLKTGSHISAPETILYSASSIKINYGEDILLQLDGEGYPLTAADFPLVMELTEPFISILVPPSRI